MADYRIAHCEHHYSSEGDRVGILETHPDGYAVMNQEHGVEIGVAGDLWNARLMIEG